jgi:hypothetical protein
MAQGSPMRLLAAITLVIGTLLLAAGCGEPSPDESIAPTDPTIGCIGVPASTCRQVVDGIRSNGFQVPPASIQVTCTPGICTELQGAVSIEVVYADGSRSSSGFVWGAAGNPVQVPGPPALTVVPVCIRIDAKQCRNMAENALGGRQFPPPIRSIVVTCTGRCDATNGSGTTVITYANGTTDHGDWTYEGAAPAAT